MTLESSQDTRELTRQGKLENAFAILHHGTRFWIFHSSPFDAVAIYHCSDRFSTIKAVQTQRHNAKVPDACVSICACRLPECRDRCRGTVTGLDEKSREGQDREGKSCASADERRDESHAHEAFQNTDTTQGSARVRILLKESAEVEKGNESKPVTSPSLTPRPTELLKSPLGELRATDHVTALRRFAIRHCGMRIISSMRTAS